MTFLPILLNWFNVLIPYPSLHLGSTTIMCQHMKAINLTLDMRFFDEQLSLDSDANIPCQISHTHELRVICFIS